MNKIQVKPMSVNLVFQGRRFRVKAYDDYELLVRSLLPKITLPDAPYEVFINYGFSSKAAELRQQRDEFKTKFEQVEQEKAFNQSFGAISQAAFDALKLGNWKSGTRPEEQVTRERTIKELITNRVKAGKIRLEDGLPVVYDDNGKRLQTSDFVPIPFSEYVVNNGTVTPPAFIIAISVISHSGRFSDNKTHLSPGCKFFLKYSDKV